MSQPILRTFQRRLCGLILLNHSRETWIQNIFQRPLVIAPCWDWATTERNGKKIIPLDAMDVCNAYDTIRAKQDGCAGSALILWHIDRSFATMRTTPMKIEKDHLIPRPVQGDIQKERLKGLSEIGSILGLQTEDISRSGEGFKQVNEQVATATRLELKFITLAPLECPYHIICIQSTCNLWPRVEVSLTVLLCPLPVPIWSFHLLFTKLLLSRHQGNDRTVISFATSYDSPNLSLITLSNHWDDMAMRASITVWLIILNSFKIIWRLQCDRDFEGVQPSIVG